MKTKKFIVIGLISIAMLVGCGTPNAEINGNQAETQAVAPATLSEEDNQEANNQDAVAEETAGEKKVKAVEETQLMEQETVKKVIGLGELIGKKQEDVIALLGKAETSKNLEETNILLADYYKETVYDQEVKLEVVYNDEEQVVNFVNMNCVQTENVESFVEGIAAELTAQFGESSIEKITNVRGTRRRQWENEGLTYVLSYIEDHVILDIYEADQ